MIGCGCETGDAIATLIGVTAGESIEVVPEVMAGDIGASAGLAAGTVGGMSYFWI